MTDQIPIEDEFHDILGKAQRGLGQSPDKLASTAGLTSDRVRRVLDGEVDEEAIRNLAGALQLGAGALVAIARQAYYPDPVQLDGLAIFNTPYHDMRVNAFLLWDPESLQAAVFDTGADCQPILEAVEARNLKVEMILITHAHRDHIADLERLRTAFGARVLAPTKEPVPRAEPLEEQRALSLGTLSLQTRLTSGHSPGALTYVVQGLARPVAVVGDSLFAGSMGGGMVSYADALENNRRKILTLPEATVVCPGHGPMTSVGLEKQNNPFFPEFQR